MDKYLQFRTFRRNTKYPLNTDSGDSAHQILVDKVKSFCTDEELIKFERFWNASLIEDDYED